MKIFKFVAQLSYNKRLEKEVIMASKAFVREYIIKNKASPFELKVPNEETRAAMAEADAILKARRARFAKAQDVFDALDQEARQD